MTSAGSAGSGSSAAPVATSDALSTGSTSLGAVVFNGMGHTVYLFTNDTPNSGTSTCTGQCAATWHAVTTTSPTPAVKGVTGTVATIKLADGTLQVTLNGWPLYTYANDSAIGDVSGQKVKGTWFAVSPAGNKITAAAGSTGSTSGGSGAGGGWS